ncbi:MAG: hypothetical protein KA354_12475 [Phycisphaerae bacterium]|nr:hypothetical protein [Phycisphaerae bacterium]
METLLGACVVGIAGLLTGSGAWPFKLMRKYQFEHWWLIAMLIALIIIPWSITLFACPDPIEGLRAVPLRTLIKANLFAAGWGIANVLCGLCFVRIGMALTGAILAGLGVCVGTIVPLVFKGTGLFKDAPDLNSPAGMAVLAGVGVMLIGVLFATFAGFGRDRQLTSLQADNKQRSAQSGSFLGGLIMTAVAGVLSAGLSLAFVYSQGPIIANLCLVRPNTEIKVKVNAEGQDELARRFSKTYSVSAEGTMEVEGVGTIAIGGQKAAHAAERIRERLASALPGGQCEVGVDTGAILAVFGVWAAGLFAGSALNVAYALYLLTRNKSWHVFGESWRDAGLAVIMGVTSIIAVGLQGKGMLMLGALGASIGFGIQQAMQMTGSQGVGFISGEWRGVKGKPRYQMYVAIGVLIVAAIVMAYGNTLAKS